MRFAQYDYRQDASSKEVARASSFWSAHWCGRISLRENLSDEPLWPTIRDVLIRPGRVLEAGCGTGQWVQFLGRLGHDTIGVDYALTGLEVGRACNRFLKLVQADFRRLPFESRCFDYVVSLGAVEHDIEGPETALREFYRVLRPNGRLMCSVPCLNLYRLVGLPWLVTERWLKSQWLLRRILGRSESFEFYQYLWTPSQYAALLTKCGFGVLDMRPYGRVLKSRLGRLVDRAMQRISGLFSAHMIMAVCTKA